MAQEPTSATTATLFVDDFHLSALLIQPDQAQPAGDFQVSDAMYAGELQLQEALMASAEAVSNRAVQEARPSTTEVGSSSASTSGCGAENEVDVATGDGQTRENFRMSFLTALHLLTFKPIFFLVSSLFFTTFHHFPEKVKSIISKARKKHSGNTAQQPTPTPASSSSSTLFVDDFYLSALLIQPQDQPSGDFQVLDSMYAEVQLQEALMACAEAVSNPTVQETPPSTTEIGSSSGSSGRGTEDEDGEATGDGQTPENICGICGEIREADEMFRSVKCRHAFCSYCISEHLAVKIQENSSSGGLTASPPLFGMTGAAPLNSGSSLFGSSIPAKIFGSSSASVSLSEPSTSVSNASLPSFPSPSSSLSFGAPAPSIPAKMFGSSSGGLSSSTSLSELSTSVGNASLPSFPSPSSSFLFGVPAPSGVSPFGFGGQQNPVTPQNPSSSQASGSLEFGAARSFSLGTGGSDKSNRRVVNVRRLQRKK